MAVDQKLRLAKLTRVEIHRLKAAYAAKVPMRLIVERFRISVPRIRRLLGLKERARIR